MRRFLATFLLGAALFLTAPAGSAQAQTAAPAPAAASAPAATTYDLDKVYRAPGYYGTSWGVASYGTRRTYSEFSSPYGAGYSYGYAPYGVLPGRYGVGLWRTTASSPGQIYGAPAGYSTYARPFRPVNAAPGPPMGAYAPGFGPGLPPIMLGH